MLVRFFVGEFTKYIIEVQYINDKTVNGVGFVNLSEEENVC